MVDQRTRGDEHDLERRKIELQEQLLDLQEKRLDIEQKRIELELRKLEIEVNPGGGTKEAQSSAENSADETLETFDLRCSINSMGSTDGEEEYMQVIKGHISDDSVEDSADESDGVDFSADEEPIQRPRERKDTSSRSRSSSQGDIKNALPRSDIISSTHRSSSRSKHRRSSRQRTRSEKNENDPDSPLPPLSNSSKSSRKLCVPPMVPRKGLSPMGRESSRKKRSPTPRGSMSSVDTDILDDAENHSDRSADRLESLQRHSSLPSTWKGGDLSDGEKTTKRSNGSSHGVSPNQVALVDVDVTW